MKAGAGNPEKFINRELSWLAFNTRVMEEARNTAHPLLERLKFLSISAGNLDEFYMVRVAGLRSMVELGVEERSADGMTPGEQLDAIRKSSLALMRNHQECWAELKKELAKQGVEIVSGADLGKNDLEWIREFFYANVFPALTPIAVDPANPFPFLPNLGIALALLLKRRQDGRAFHAVVSVPGKLGRFISLPGVKKTARLVPIEEAVQLFSGEMFCGFDVVERGVCRVTRDSELEIADDAEDLVKYYELALKQRRRGKVVRLGINSGMPEGLKAFLASNLRVDERDIVAVAGLPGLAGAAELYALDRPELKFPPFQVRFPERINDYGGDCFAAIEAKDIVVHHPYESFDVVVKFLRQAASDPDVVAIKQTLYRTSNDSPIVRALIEAAEAGKSVTALVELKARFDEEANIRLARALERAGAQVVYGFVHLKTHAKISLVVRKSSDGTLKSYAHFGTGNYHPVNARVYTDLSFFTCDPALCRDAAYLFNYLTGYSTPEKFEKIAVAPLNLRENLLRLIEDEKKHAKAGRPAGIWAKMNALVDEELIEALYSASQQGVGVDLVIRGVCCLRPGVKGLSENIRVKSIVGRFLEHSRVFCFAGGHKMPSKENKVFISSADWMRRNMKSRIEVMVPIENATVHEQILGQVMASSLRDEKQSWIMNPDGGYVRKPFGENSFSSHQFFMTNPSLSGRGRKRKS